MIAPAALADKAPMVGEVVSAVYVGCAYRAKPMLVYRFPSDIQVPGVPDTVQTQDLGLPMAGLLLNTRSPLLKDPEAGAEVS